MTAIDNTRAIWVPLLGTMLFVSVLPASVIVVVPFLITRWQVHPPLLGLTALRWLGGGLALVGGVFFVDFCARFVVEGRGTPAPVAPTRHLVTGGPFRHVRNPGYLSVLALVVGQGLVFGSAPVLAYAVVLALGFHIFVVLYEEPTLRRQFGPEYEAYCRRVPRWLPRRTAGGGAHPRGTARP